MVGICFFYGSSVPSLLVRLRTRRRGQSLAEVPSHVGIIAGSHPAYYEAIVSGVHRLPVKYRARAMWVNVPDEASLVSYLEDQIGEPYDWAAIISDTIGRDLPWEVQFSKHRKRAHDCSGLVADALLIGGYPLPHQALPETPNGLLQALREVAGVSTHQGHKSPERTHTMGLLNWLNNRLLKLPQADDNAVDKTLGVPAGTTAALNTEAVDVVEGDAVQAIEKAVTGK